MLASASGRRHLRVMATRRQPDPARKILAVRAAHGNTGEACPTCGRPASQPTRRYAGGRVVEGCVDALHTTVDLTGYQSGDSQRWQHRAEAIEIRRAEGRALGVCR